MIPVKTHPGTGTNTRKGRAAGQIARETTEPTPLGSVIKKKKKKCIPQYHSPSKQDAGIQTNVSWAARHPAQWSSVFCAHNVSLCGHADVHALQDIQTHTHII